MSEDKNLLLKTITQHDLELLLQFTFDGLLILQDNKIIDLNNAFTDITGYTKKELLGTDILDLFDDSANNHVVLMKLSHPSPARFTLRIKNKNGNTVHIDIQTRDLNLNGKPIIASTIRDITTFKTTEQTLTLNEKKLRNLFDYINDAWISTTLTNKIIDCNKSLITLLGYTKKELTQLTYNDITPLKWHQSEKKIVSEILINKLTKGAYEKEFIKNNGTTIPVKISVHVNKGYDGLPSSFWFLVKDLTEQKKAKKELYDSQQRYRLLLENSGIGIGYYNLSGRAILLNNIAARELQGQPSDFVGKSLFELYGGDFGKKYYQRILQSARFNHPLEFEDLVQTSSGDKWYLSIYSKIFDERKEINGVQIATHDITGRKQAEIALRENEEKFRLLFSNMHNAFALHKIITDNNNVPIDYEFIEVNPEFENLTGLKKDNIINKRVLEVLPGIEDKWIEKYGKVALTGKPNNFLDFSITFNKYFEVSAYSPKPGYFATTFSDVTRRITFEKEVGEYQQKLKALNSQLVLIEEKEKRRLAINLHDHFSQLLAISKMKTTELINYSDTEHIKSELEEIRKYLDKALTNSRKLTYELSPPILYELGLIHAIKWKLQETKETYGISYRFIKKISTIKLDESTQIMLYRIFSELITNITKHAKAKVIKVFIDKINDLLYLVVKDDGIGFNTDSNMTKKSSFGIFSIKERIDYLNGALTIESAYKQGTKIKITLPLNKKK